MIRTDQPLYLPRGSIRSILALAVVGAYFLGAVSDEIALMVLGSYFVGRASASTSTDDRLQDRADVRASGDGSGV